jgi:large subunit ribosomal protein L4
MISHSLIRLPAQGTLEWAHTCKIKIKIFLKIILDFPKEEKMTIPVFELTSNSFSGENVVLSQEIFNQVIRRDIIHKVLQYNRMYNRQTFKWVMSKGDVSGSNRKPFQQKKTGRARQGDIRAPNLYHGGRAHGARPRDYYFPLNKKVRLMGLKCMLTSKFLENNIIIINSEKMENNRADLLDKYLSFMRNNRCLVVTARECDKNFLQASKQLPYVHQIDVDKLNVASLMDNKVLIFTKDGLSELVELLADRYTNYFRNRKIPLNPESKKIQLPTDQFKFDFDPSLPLEIHTPALKGSMDKLNEYFQDPEGVKQRAIQERDAAIKAKIDEKKQKKQQSVDNLYSDSSLMEKRRRQLRRERRLKLLKEERRQTIKKKKQADAAVAAANDRKKK